MTNVQKHMVRWGALGAGAVGAGVLFILQHLVVWYRLWQQGSPYSFFTFVHPDPLVNLAPMVRDVMDGRWWVADGRIWENSHLPNLWSVFDLWLIAPLTWLTQSVSWTFLVGHFLVAAVTFLVVYLLALHVVGARRWAVGFAVLFSSAPLLGYYVLPTSWEHIALVVRTVLPVGSPPGEILMSKYVSFSVLPGLPLFAAAFLLIVRALERIGRFFVYLAGICLGLLIQVYITDALYICVALVLMAGMFFMTRRYQEAKRSLMVIALALVVSIPYWWNYAAMQSLPWADEFIVRIGGELTRQFRWSQWPLYVVVGLLSGLVWWLGKRMGRPVLAVYLVGLSLSSVVVLNLQVLLGYNPAPSVWPLHQLYFGFFLVWLFVAHSAHVLMRPRHALAARTMVAVLVFVVVSVTARVVHTQLYIASYLAPTYAMPAGIARSLDWLNTHAPKDAVVVSPSLVTNALLPVWTHTNTLVPVAVTSAASGQEIIDRFFVAYRLFGTPSSYVEHALQGRVPLVDAYAHTQENGLTTWLFESYYVDHGIDGYINKRTAEIPASVAQELLAAYARYPTRWQYLRNRYRVDYLYVGPYERAMIGVDFDAMDGLERVYAEGDVSIYRILPSSAGD